MIRFRIGPIPSSSGKDPSPTPLPALLPRPLVSGVLARDIKSDISAGVIFASRRERDELLNEEAVDLSLNGIPCGGRVETSFAVVKAWCITLVEGSRLSVISEPGVLEFGGSF